MACFEIFWLPPLVLKFLNRSALRFAKFALTLISFEISSGLFPCIFFTSLFVVTEKTGFEIFSVFGVVSKSKVFAGESNMSIVLFY